MRQERIVEGTLHVQIKYNGGKKNKNNKNKYYLPCTNCKKTNYS